MGEADSVASTRDMWTAGYDVVLLDIKFPDGNGIDVCREIKETDPHFTVIMSSSMEEVEAWDQSFRAGADGYLEKRELLALDPRKIQLTIMSLVERNRLRRQAQETAERQRELMSVLSHDVRAPFQAMLRAIETIRGSELAPEIAQEVSNLYKCASGQLNFINSLLEVLRLESGAAELRRTYVDLSLPVNQSAQNLAPSIKAKNVELEVVSDPQAPEANCDIARICQLVTNLLSNAIKFTPSNGKIRIGVRKSRRLNTDGVEVSVEDSGTGIKRQDRENILSRFVRGPSGGSNGETGSGLGLSICREILNLHSGKLEISDSNLGGAMVIAWLPLDDPVSDRSSKGAQQNQNCCA
jgi:signal transduction histidine kinase